MRTFERQTPEGPVLEIQMQTFDDVDCTECGRVVWQDEATTQRIVYPDGTAAQRYVCRKCVARVFGGNEPPDLYV